MDVKLWPQLYAVFNLSCVCFSSHPFGAKDTKWFQPKEDKAGRDPTQNQPPGLKRVSQKECVRVWLCSRLTFCFLLFSCFHQTLSQPEGLSNQRWGISVKVLIYFDNLKKKLEKLEKYKKRTRQNLEIKPKRPKKGNRRRKHYFLCVCTG